MSRAAKLWLSVALGAAACSKDPASAGPVVTASPLPDRVAVDGPRFAKLPSAATGLTFRNELRRENTVAYVYMGAGLTVGDYDGDGLPDLYLVSQDGANKLFRQAAPLQFEDVTATAGAGLDGGDAWGTAASFADVDGDGDLDLYVCNLESPNLLFVNQGDGTFVEKAGMFGLGATYASTGAAFADDRSSPLADATWRAIRADLKPPPVLHAAIGSFRRRGRRADAAQPEANDEPPPSSSSSSKKRPSEASSVARPSPPPSEHGSPKRPRKSFVAPDRDRPVAFRDCVARPRPPGAAPTPKRHDDDARLRAARALLDTQESESQPQSQSQSPQKRGEAGVVLHRAESVQHDLRTYRAGGCQVRRLERPHLAVVTTFYLEAARRWVGSGHDGAGGAVDRDQEVGGRRCHHERLGNASGQTDADQRLAVVGVLQAVRADGDVAPAVALGQGDAVGVDLGTLDRRLVHLVHARGVGQEDRQRGPVGEVGAAEIDVSVLGWFDADVPTLDHQGVGEPLEGLVRVVEDILDVAASGQKDQHLGFLRSAA